MRVGFPILSALQCFTHSYLHNNSKLLLLCKYMGQSCVCDHGMTVVFDRLSCLVAG